MTVDNSSPMFGEAVLATVTIANTTSATLSRVFPPGQIGPIASPTSANILINGFDGTFFGDVVDLGLPHTLTIPAGGTVTHVWHVIATHAGSATISACFPETDSGPTPNVCASTRLTITGA